MKKTYRPIIGILAVGIIVYSGSWYYLSRQFEQHMEQQLAFVQTKGFDVSFDSLKISGFPFGYDVNIKKLEIRRGDVFRTWVDGDITFSAKLWNPKEITSMAGGTHHLVFDNIKTQGQGFILRSLTFDPLRFQFFYDDLQVLINNQESFKAKAIEYDIDLTPEDDRAAADIKIRLAELEAPAIKDNHFGNKIEQLVFEASIQGDIKGNTSFERMTKWYESEGILDIRQFALKWGELHLSAEGTFSVDEDLQPIAALTASIEGLDKVVDTLASRGVIAPGTANLVKLGVGFLSGEDSKLSFSIQDRKVMLGSIPVSEVPRIDWK